jgi:hypothetical protein
LPDFRHVDDQAITRLRERAAEARAALIAVGIPAFDSETLSDTGGARFEVDTGDDTAGDIHVSWRFSRQLEEELGDYYLRKEFTHPTLKYSGQVRHTMRDAILAIFTAAGFSAELSKDDIRPLSISVS